ncbi:MAG TPA: DUF3306 domain-containing protein [Ramlibacter sp.]|jgi:hypothetical protein|nr:DUF3306 domain-containing protein [Ramlibacter sp.]
MADGFLGRWAKRKEAVRQGKEVAAEPVKEAGAPLPSPQPSPAGGRGSLQDPKLPLPLAGEGRGEGSGETQSELQPPPPTLQDVQSLDPKQSDFTRFVRADVDPQVKNAAFKKLFTDPHYNVMDGLDIYIDDYGKPDPIPPEMLKQLASAKFLRLFEEKPEEKEEVGEAGDNPEPCREAADVPAEETVAQSGSRTEQALPPADEHADPDLRLQQDDAPGPEGPGAGSR